MPAHLVTHAEEPNYYRVWVNDKDHEEMIQFFRNIEEDHIFRVVLTFDMEEKQFEDYMKATFTDHLPGGFIGYCCRIDDISNPHQWIDGFPAWKEEKERLQREHWLKQYQKETKGQTSLF